MPKKRAAKTRIIRGFYLFDNRMKNNHSDQFFVRTAGQLAELEETNENLNIENRYFRSQNETIKAENQNFKSENSKLAKNVKKLELKLELETEVVDLWKSVKSELKIQNRKWKKIQEMQEEEIKKDEEIQEEEEMPKLEILPN